METLASYLGQTWVVGDGPQTTLINPATEEAVASACTRGLDFAGALNKARNEGAQNLQELTFAQRGAILRQLAETMVAHRKELLGYSIINNGATRSDSKFDVDGASFTLQAYADLGESLGDKRYLVDGDTQELLRSKRLAGLHIRTPRHGVAVHINAFNFPAWGLAEKFAVAFLAGMPVLTKPATATCLTSYHLAKAFVEADVLPPHTFGFIAGSAGDLVDHLQFGDALAFTGSNGLGMRFKRELSPKGIAVNVEADSLNAAILGPDVDSSDETWNLFIRDVFRDMHQKTGQKCTAIRRVLVPTEMVDEVTEALVDLSSRLKIGNPANNDVRMGPVVSAQQNTDVAEGLSRLGSQVKKIHGGGRPANLIDVDNDKGYFFDVHLFQAADQAASLAADAVHGHEVFGPAATILPYDGTAQSAGQIIALGGGGLVASSYSNDRQFQKDLVLRMAPYHGRITMGSEKIAESSPGPGTVLPQLVHGGPGRAGGGEELGGIRGLEFYLQRTAIQGYRPLVEKLFDGS
jgi:3,4-dehydroadipyl-CoA semialdehyde dehydrogenase